MPNKHPQLAFAESLFRTTRDNAIARGAAIPPLCTRRLRDDAAELFEVLARLPDARGKQTLRPIWQGPATCAADAKTRAIESVYLPMIDNQQGSFPL